jgi:hypothetical protein
MADLYYFAAWTNSGCLCGCDHNHPTVVSAVVCAQSAGAGSYVVAVEDRQYRALDKKEEREFQLAMYGAGILRGTLRALRSLTLTQAILN